MMMPVSVLVVSASAVFHRESEHGFRALVVNCLSSTARSRGSNERWDQQLWTPRLLGVARGVWVTAAWQNRPYRRRHGDLGPDSEVRPESANRDGKTLLLKLKRACAHSKLERCVECNVCVPEDGDRRGASPPRARADRSVRVFRRHVFGMKGDVKDNIAYVDESTVLYPAGHNTVL